MLIEEERVAANRCKTGVCVNIKSGLTKAAYVEDRPFGPEQKAAVWPEEFGEKGN